MEKRDKFSEQWNEAFEGAELAPDKAVWSGIRADMANQSADKYKRSAFYFRWMAAASITLLIGVVAASSYYYSKVESSDSSELAIASYEEAVKNEKTNTNNDEVESSQQNAEMLQQTQNIEFENAVVENQNPKIEELENNTAAGEFDEKIASTDDGYLKNKQITKFNGIANSQSVDSDKEMLEKDVESIVVQENQDEGNEEVTENLSKLKEVNRMEYTALIEEPLNDVYLQPIPDIDVFLIKRDKIGYQDLWAGLSFGGGNFNPNMSYDQSSVALTAFEDAGVNNLSAPVANAQVAEQTPAFSYGMGFDLGKKVGANLVIQSGLTYQKYTSETISSFELQNGATNQNEAFLLSNDRALSADEVLSFTDTYQVSNEFEYLSVPVELGYLIVNRKVGFLLSSGVSTDMFIKNKVSDDSNLREDVTVTNGDNSPYKTFNFNGLVGGELYYTFNDHYLVALKPSYKFSIDGITKSEANFLSKPQSLFIGFKFKYFIK